MSRHLGQMDCECIELGYLGAHLYAAAHDIYLLFDHPDPDGYGVPGYLMGALWKIQEIARRVSTKWPAYSAAMAAIVAASERVRAAVDAYEGDGYSQDYTAWPDEEQVLDLFQACQEVSDAMVEDCAGQRGAA